MKKMKYIIILLLCVTIGVQSRRRRQRICKDVVTGCGHFVRYCNVADAGWKKWMTNYCSKTCGLCTVSPTTAPPYTPMCGIKGRSHTRIVGGDIAAPGDWPWQVTYDWVGNAFNKGHWCGASIISSNWILTAAHCFVNSEKPEDYTLTVGDFDISKNEGHEQKIKIEKIILHELYNVGTMYDYDVALLKLSDQIRFTERVRPVCLPDDGMDFPTGTDCYVTGWGKLEELGDFPKRLYQARVPLVDHQQCKTAYALNHGYTITERMKCAGFAKGGIDACQGDSGGPLVCGQGNKWHLMGAVSWGVGCAREKSYGVYADISYLKPWIIRNIQN